MRSVVVVLPASMWAMIPMFRVFSRVNLRGMGLSLSACVRLLGRPSVRAKKTGLSGPLVFIWRSARGTGLCLEALHVTDRPGGAARADARFAPPGEAPW